MLKAGLRIISNTNSRTYVGEHHSFKTGQRLVYESKSEMDMLLSLEANPDIARLNVQCQRFTVWIDHTKHTYIPDVEVIWRDVWRPRWYIECKSIDGGLSDEARQKYEAVADQLDFLGFRFSLHRHPEILASPAYQNARELRQNAAHRCRRDEWLTIQRKIPCTLGMLDADPLIDRRTVRNFLWFGELHFDRSKRLTPHTLISSGRSRLIWTS